MFDYQRGLLKETKNPASWRMPTPDVAAFEPATPSLGADSGSWFCFVILATVFRGFNHQALVIQEYPPKGNFGEVLALFMFLGMYVALFTSESRGRDYLHVRWLNPNFGLLEWSPPSTSIDPAK